MTEGMAANEKAVQRCVARLLSGWNEDRLDPSTRHLMFFAIRDAANRAARKVVLHPRTRDRLRSAATSAFENLLYADEAGLVNAEEWLSASYGVVERRKLQCDHRYREQQRDEIVHHVLRHVCPQRLAQPLPVRHGQPARSPSRNREPKPRSAPRLSFGASSDEPASPDADPTSPIAGARPWGMLL